jgi:hypothetical protein
MEQIARWKPGQNVPGFASTAVIGGRFVKIAGDKTSQGDYSIAPCGAGQQAFGVAEQDSAPTTQPSSSVERRVNVVRPGAIARVLAGTDLAAGVAVASDANGKAVAATTGDHVLGYTCTSADVDTGQYAEVDLQFGGIL